MYGQDQDFAKNISDQLDELNGSINRLINLFNNQAELQKTRHSDEGICRYYESL